MLLDRRLYAETELIWARFGAWTVYSSGIENEALGLDWSGLQIEAPFYLAQWLGHPRIVIEDLLKAVYVWRNLQVLEKDRHMVESNIERIVEITLSAGESRPVKHYIDVELAQAIVAASPHIVHFQPKIDSQRARLAEQRRQHRERITSHEWPNDEAIAELISYWWARTDGDELNDNDIRSLRSILYRFSVYGVKEAIDRTLKAYADKGYEYAFSKIESFKWIIENETWIPNISEIYKIRGILRKETFLDQKEQEELVRYLVIMETAGIGFQKLRTLLKLRNPYEKCVDYIKHALGITCVLPNEEGEEELEQYI